MDLERLIGDPRKVDRELAKFRETTKLLSADRPRLIDQYSKQWVALCDNQVRASAPTLEELMAEVDRQGLQRRQLIVRYIDRELRTMVL
jgi:hypothetical protein